MKKWRVINKQNNANLFPYAIHVLAMGKGFRKTFGRAYDNLVELKNNGLLTQAADWPQYHSLGKNILKRLLKQPRYAEKVLRETAHYMNAWYKFTETIIKSDITHYNNNQLAKHIKNFAKLFYSVSSWGVLISIVEYEHELLTKKLRELLQQKIRHHKLPITGEDLFQLVTTKFAKTYVVKERDDLLRLAFKIETNKKWQKLFRARTDKIITSLNYYSKLIELVNKHYQKYIWLNFGFAGPELSMEDIIRSLTELIKENPLRVKQDLITSAKNYKKRQEYYLGKLGLNSAEAHLIKIARDFGFSKAYRKDIEYHANYAYHKLLQEIGRRFNFTVQQGHYLTPQELVNIIVLHKAVDINLVNNRIKHSIYLVRAGCPELLTGRAARHLQRQFYEATTSQASDQITGQCAMSGYARGTVKIILDQKDFGKFYAHNILVTYATNPSMVPLMKMARAIITDQGGVTCHAAIISRELGVPCVIGTKIATKTLRDGDLVEVDASKGIINKL